MTETQKGESRAPLGGGGLSIVGPFQTTLEIVMEELIVSINKLTKMIESLNDE